jgi:putative NIF3 family GTP cyclohydrolase 1 type 2
MKLELLSQLFDKEFNAGNNGENLVEFAVTYDNKKCFSQEFLANNTGLINSNSVEIEKVFTVVFITQTIVNKLIKERNSLIFTHHHFNYHEDERGILPVSPEIYEALKKAGISVYVAHAPLDTHKVYGTSLALAEICKIKPEKLFFDYLGAPAALLGNTDKMDFETFSETVRQNIQRPFLTLHKHKDNVGKIAVVAGGGDMPELLQQAFDLGCDTLLTGTVEHRWALPVIQENNRKFHELNNRLKLNLIGGTHYATERPAMIKVVKMIRTFGLNCEYCEDEMLLNSL